LRQYALIFLTTYCRADGVTLSLSKGCSPAFYYVHSLHQVAFHFFLKKKVENKKVKEKANAPLLFPLPAHGNNHYALIISCDS
jgi:hypothetical protein